MRFGLPKTQNKRCPVFASLETEQIHVIVGFKFGRPELVRIFVTYICIETERVQIGASLRKPLARSERTRLYQRLD